MSHKVTFNVKDEEGNPLGAVLLVGDFLDEDWGKGELDGLASILDTLQIPPGTKWYNEGDESPEWELTIPHTSGEPFTKEEDHFYIVTQATRGNGDQVATAEKVSLAGISTIAVDWSSSLYNSNNNENRLLVLNNNDDGYGSAVKVLLSPGNFERRVDTLDVSDLEGEYYIGISQRRDSGIAYTLRLDVFNVHGRDAHGNAIDWASEGFRISPPTDLSEYAETAPDLRIKWKATVPIGTTLIIETAVTDSDTVNPAEEDWNVQTSGGLITDLPADLTGKYLYTRVKMDTEEIGVSPGVIWLIVYDNDGSPNVALWVELNNSSWASDIFGKVEVEGLEPGVYTYKANIINLAPLYIYGDYPELGFVVGRHDRTFDISIPIQRQYYTGFTEEGPEPVDMALEIIPVDYNVEFLVYKLHYAWSSSDNLWSIVAFNDEKVLRHYTQWSSGVNSSSAFWYKPGLFMDVTATAKAYLVSGENKRPSVVLRGKGNHGNRTGYVFRCSRADNEAQIIKYVGGVATTIASDAFSFSDNNWYNIKAECVGTTVRMKLWLEGTSEPADWTLTATDIDIGQGYCGVYDRGRHSSYFKDLHVVGTPVSPPDWRHGWRRLVRSCVPYIDDEVGASGDKVLRVWNPSGSNEEKFYCWGIPVPAYVVETKTRMKSSVVSGNTYLLCIQGAGTQEFGYVAKFNDSNGGFALLRYHRGGSTSLGSFEFPVDSNEWVILKMRYNYRGEIWVKAWKEPDPEPEEWNLHATDNVLDIIGFVGVAAFASDGSVQTYDYVSVGTNGATAPEEAV